MQVKNRSSVKKVTIPGTSISFGEESQLTVIAGPCVIESEDSALRHAEKISEIAREQNVAYVFKASYDKANRSSHKSYRGPGLEEGIKILKKVKDTFDLPVLSDVHSCEELEVAGDILDIIQIPAFLSRQTDLLQAAAKTGKVVNVKKGQFLAPWDMKNIIEKIEDAGNENILLTERGVSFGYNQLVSDFRAIPIMRDLGYPVVFDATHSVQQPGGLGTVSGGKSEFIPTLAKCGVVSGADALFFEVHENPKEALSDGPNAFPLEQFAEMLDVCKRLREVVTE